MRRIGVIAAIGFLAVLAAPAGAQDWPNRPVTMLVPYAPGGSFDVMGRIFAARMSETLGQPVIVENVSGAGGTIGASRVARASPDGSVFLLGSIGTQVYSQAVYRKPPVRDQIADLGAAVVAPERRSSEYLARFLTDEIDKWSVAIKASGVQLD